MGHKYFYIAHPKPEFSIWLLPKRKVHLLLGKQGLQWPLHGSSCKTEAPQVFRHKILLIEIKIQGRPGSSWKGECTAQGCFCSRAQSHNGSWCGVWSQPSEGRAQQGGCGTAPGLKTQLLLLCMALGTLGMVYSSTACNQARHCNSTVPSSTRPDLSQQC